jgi:proliferating cell nuclear antigen PCNA
MFEARLTQGKVFKQLIEALKDLVQEANIDCTDDEMSIQAMDNSHVALVAVCLRSGGFDHFRCDRPISLGFNATNMGKILKCAGNDDIITLKAEDDGDSLALVFESPSQDRIADFGECVFFIVRFFPWGEGEWERAMTALCMRHFFVGHHGIVRLLFPALALLVHVIHLLSQL